MPAAEHSQGLFLSGVILAAGASSRMRRPKQLLPLGGRPLLQWIVDEAAASCLDEVVIVLGHRAHEIRKAIRLPNGCPTRVVINGSHSSGLASSLGLGLRSARDEAAAAAVLLGDQPGVAARLIDKIAAAFVTAGALAARPVYERRGGVRTPGHPVFLARRMWPEVENLVGDCGAGAVLAAHPEWLVEVAVAGEPPVDIDTWEEYRTASNGER